MVPFIIIMEYSVFCLNKSYLFAVKTFVAWGRQLSLWNIWYLASSNQAYFLLKYLLYEAIPYHYGTPAILFKAGLFSLQNTGINISSIYSVQNHMYSICLIIIQRCVEN